MDKPGRPSPLPSQPEEEDHDLLTYSEVGDRLTAALAEQEGLVARLEASGEEDAAEAARVRLALMLQARERNRRTAITAISAAEFYGLGPEGDRQVLRGM